MNAQNHIKSLDGLRAIAIILVIFRHWHFPHLNLEFGWIGVNLFFVLSGFLITGILRKDKIYSLGRYLKHFYLKRCLRIFPIYYLYIFLCIIFFTAYLLFFSNFWHFTAFDNAALILQENVVSLLTYTYNFHNLFAVFEGVNEGGSKFFGHLWSLCIEEQFYIFFPLVVFFLNEKQLKKFLIVIILISPVIRAIGGEYLKSIGENHFQVGLVVYKTTFFQLDGLALGALLALVGWQNIRYSSKTLVLIFFSIIILNLLTVFFIRHSGENASYFSFGFDLAANQAAYNTGIFLLDIKYAYSFCMLNFLSIILIIFSLRTNIFSTILSLKPLVRIGEISYGIYLYHNPFFDCFLILITYFGLAVKNISVLHEVIYFSVYVILVYFISSISYRLVEIPFLKLKKKIKI